MEINILNGEEITLQGLEIHDILKQPALIILNHQFTQKLKLIGEGKFNIISNTTQHMLNNLNKLHNTINYGTTLTHSFKHQAL